MAGNHLKISTLDVSDSKESALFNRIKQKIATSNADALKSDQAMQRLERLKKYLTSQDSETLNNIKSKMTQDLVKYAEKINHDHNSHVLERLNQSLKIKGEVMDVLKYAEQYYNEHDRKPVTERSYLKIEENKSNDAYNDVSYSFYFLLIKLWLQFAIQIDKQQSHLNNDQEEDLKDKQLSEIEEILINILDVPNSKSSKTVVSERLNKLKAELEKERKLRLEQEKMIKDYRKELELYQAATK